MPKKLETILHDAFAERALLYAVLSSPLHKDSTQRSKIVIRPVMIKQELLYQITEFQGQQTFHKNISSAECLQLIQGMLGAFFEQGLICTPKNDFHVLINKKGKITILSKPPTKQQLVLTHNRKKHYILEEGVPNPFLIALGIMSPEGKVLAKKSDKFKQLNRFLEMVNDVLPHLDKSKKLHIIDFGCGKASLTFALYHFLKHIHGYDLDVVGLDLKKEVIDNCQQLAQKLGYNNLNFILGDINNYSPASKVDMVITLHACDTATDAALEKAVRWNAEVILCVPCCQHELYEQVKNPTLAPILRHGILKERFAALATDAARAHLLEILGYHTQVLEFIDLEHTPKNLLIRAVLKANKTASQHAIEEYRIFKTTLNIIPSLERRFQAELKKTLALTSD